MTSDLLRKESSKIEYYLPFFLLLSQYKVGVISLGAIGLIILAGIRLVKNGGRIPLVKTNSVTLLLIYVLVRDCINILFHVNEISTIFNKTLEYLVIYLLSIYVTDTEFHEDRLYSAWKVAGILFMGGLVYQMLMVYGLGRSVSPISIFPGYVLRSEEISLRPSSFFAEPASFVCAMLPLEYLALKRTDYKWAFFTTLSIIATTSTVGIVLSAVLWGLALVQMKISTAKKFALIVIGGIGVWVIVNAIVFDASLLKLSDALSGGSTVNSRIICGFDTIRTMDIFQWIFGTTYNNSTEYINERMGAFSITSPVHVYMAAHGHIFLNTFCQIIFNYGLIGLFLYLRIFYSRFKSNEYELKPYLVMVLVSIFAQSKFLNSIFFMELMLLLLYDNKRRDEKV